MCGVPEIRPAKTVERRQFMVEISRRVVIQGSGAVGAMILPVDELCAHTSATKIATQENGARTQSRTRLRRLPAHSNTKRHTSFSMLTKPPSSKRRSHG